MNRKSTAETEGESLRQLFKDLKARTGITQAEFARRYKVPGGPSIISQHIAGHRPISLDQANAYMEGFNCELEAISPSLAAQIPKGRSTPLSDQLVKRISSADDATRKLIEIALLEDDESAVQHLTPSLVSLVRAMKDMIREQRQAGES